MESAAKRRLGDIIVERGLVTPLQLDEALKVQRESGGKLGEVLVELGFMTRVALAGVITEQWDSLRLASRSRKTPQPRTRMETETQPSVVEIALRERLEALTVEVAARDQRIAQQDATIAALLAQLQPAAAPAPDVVLESEPQFETREPGSDPEPGSGFLDDGAFELPVVGETREPGSDPEPGSDGRGDRDPAPRLLPQRDANIGWFEL